MFKIGLIGSPRSGKSLIGKYLSEIKGYKQFAFADRIKEEYFLEGQDTEADFEKAKKENPKLEKFIRNSLWLYSDDKRLKFGELYFITPVVEKIKEHNGNIIVTDIRTIEEKNALDEIGVKFIIIVRDDNFKDGIKGIRIPQEQLNSYPVFYNNYNNLNDMYISFEKFFMEEIMDAEDSEGDSYSK